MKQVKRRGHLKGKKKLRKHARAVRQKNRVVNHSGKKKHRI